MKRENFPSSRESVDSLLRRAEAGNKLDGPSRKALRDYMAGTASSNKLSAETAKRMARIREVLGYPEAPRRGDSAPTESEDPTFEERISGKKEPNKEHTKRWRATINGVEITVGAPYGSSDADYEIFLPQVKMNFDDHGPHDQVIRISTSPEEAKKVFEHACQLAKEIKIEPKEDPAAKVAELYLALEAFIRETIWNAVDDETTEGETRWN